MYMYVCVYTQYMLKHNKPVQRYVGVLLKYF